ncbi:GTPase [Aureococcus anophagefferens]|nr:GTPase [Aureococcus anophagefferens]
MQFVHGKFTPARRVTTGADFASKVLHLGDREVRLVIWDTAGQERFHHGTLGGAFYRGADAALLVYDTTDIRTFEQIEMWRRELLQHRIDARGVPVVVVGNKVDAVEQDAGARAGAVVRWCRDLGIGLCLTSAKDGTGVAVAMEAVAMLALENKRRRQAAEPEQKRQTVVLDEVHARPVARDASCCK